MSMVLDGRLYRPPGDGNRVEAFIPSMGHENHAANMLELPNGDLLCAWFAGSREGIRDVRIALSRLPAGQDRWTQPAWLSEDQTLSEQNPVLFLTPQGEVWVLYTAQETRGGTKEEWLARVAAGEAEGDYAMQWTAVIRRRVSGDNGHIWGPVEEYFQRPGSFCRQPPVIMSNGEWLLPMYYSLPALGHADDYSVMQITADQGETWTEIEVPASRGRVHASVLELQAGHLVAFFRSRAADWIYISRSPDYGRTWTAPEPTNVPNNNSSIQAVRLDSGNIAIAFNNYQANLDPYTAVWPRRRYPVTVAISQNEGRTWPHMRNVDTGDDFCGEENKSLNRRLGYPGLIQTQDGLIHLFYSYRGRQCIKYVRFREAWVRDELEVVYGD
jgi:predicted neuraminidase